MINPLIHWNSPLVCVNVGVLSVAFSIASLICALIFATNELSPDVKHWAKYCKALARTLDVGEKLFNRVQCLFCRENNFHLLLNVSMTFLSEKKKKFFFSLENEVMETSKWCTILISLSLVLKGLSKFNQIVWFSIIYLVCVR